VNSTRRVTQLVNEYDLFSFSLSPPLFLANGSRIKQLPDLQRESCSHLSLRKHLIYVIHVRHQFQYYSDKSLLFLGVAVEECNPLLHTS